MTNDNRWIAIRKSLGNTWEIVADKGHTLQSGIYLGSYFDAYDYVRAFASSWQSLSFKVLKEDGTEWEHPKRPS